MFSIFYFLRLMRSQFLLISVGFLLGLITLLAGVGLLSLSGYLICGAAFSGVTLLHAWKFNYMLPATGIRFFAMVRIASRYGDRVCSHDATFRILASLRLWLYRKIEPLAPALFLTNRSGDLLNRLVSDVDALDHLYLRVLTPLLSAVLIAVAAWILIALFSASIALENGLIMLASIIFLPILLLYLGKKSGKHIIEQIAQLRVLLIETQQAMANFLLFNMKRMQLHKINKAQTSLYQSQRFMSHLSGLSVALVSVALAISLFFALYLGIPLVTSHQLNGAYLGFIALGIMAAYEAITPLPVAFQYLSKTQKAASRLLEIANQESSLLFPETSLAQPVDSSLMIEDLSFSYAGQNYNALSNIQLMIRPGEKLAIQGPSGSGKTSLMHLLVRFWDPSNGSITLGGVPLQELSENDLRKTICLVEQKPHTFNASVKENLLLANREADESTLWHALEVVGLADLVRGQEKQLNALMGEFGRLFSGGQLQRFALARAILHDAPIMILDEPMEGLDFLSAQQLLMKLIPLWKEKTVIMVSHQDVVLSYCDRMLEFRDGLISSEKSLS